MLIRIDNPHNRAVGRRIFAFERKTGFLSSQPEYRFPDSAAGSVNGNQRLTLRLQILVKRLDNQKLTAVKRFVLDRRNYGSYDSRQLHAKFQVPSSKFDVPGSKFRVPSSKFRVPSSNFDLPSSNFDLPSSNFDLPSSNFKVPRS